MVQSLLGTSLIGCVNKRQLMKSESRVNVGRMVASANSEILANDGGI